ncbi:hypothetical protein GCM10009535_28010 [Streptomyces thermocarboxydovorans]|uniref:Secreted protein n=1 Tax=Streptomyces thermocarboxydovorans TaxID=59298 RepID=A0ABP3SRZ9_9ACTN
MPSAAATSAHIAMLASRKAPLVSSFFFAISWVCIVDADSLIRSHRAMRSPRGEGASRRGDPGSSSRTAARIFYKNVEVSG